MVVRRRSVDGQGLLLPWHTVILVSRHDLPLAELATRHRGKQGQENAFKGPLRDMDLHHPPCRGYRANQAFYALGQIAQVLPRAVQYTVLQLRMRRQLTSGTACQGIRVLFGFRLFGSFQPEPLAEARNAGLLAKYNSPLKGPD